jgi:hypothetical protein
LGEPDGSAVELREGDAEEVEVAGGGVAEVDEGGFHDYGIDVIALRGDGDGDGSAEAGAEEGEVSGFMGVAGAEVVDDLVEVVAFPVAAGGDLAAGFAVGAEVEGEDVVAEFVEEGSPGDSADFGVGVAVEEDGGFAVLAVLMGVFVGDPPSGEIEGFLGLFIADGEGEGSEGEADVEGGETPEEPGGFAVGHARGTEEEASHEPGEEGEKEEEAGEEDEDEAEEGHLGIVGGEEGICN